MNYLAHAYLSFGNPELLVGNMISDFVKGKQKYLYPESILSGINLHREIDSFTDTHPATSAAKKLFQNPYRLYSGPFIDIVYDHFLATDPSIFDERSLKQFTADTYETLNNYRHVFPERFNYMFPYMKEHNWLYNYRFAWGMENSFAGLVRRARFMNSSLEAMEIFEKNYSVLGSYYNEFFPQLVEFTRMRIIKPG